MNVSRRQFLQSAAAVPIGLWLSRNAFAQSVPLIRHDIASPAGADMMVTYANAMRAMLARPNNDPLGWLWQWYTHFVNGATTKTSEINRIFGKKSSARKTLANEMWNTCQSHAGQNIHHFLPWHRMFVFFFEQIVRQVSGRADFALPYWDYTSADPLKRGIVPQQFRLPSDPVFGVLHRTNRTTLANTGQRIDRNQPTDQMDITSTMAVANYSTVGTVPGFCRAIDAGIHGRIHVLVGTSTNMGAVPYAARDPLFWVHHASIDRMWASWNARGGINPSAELWAARTFVFADRTGTRVVGALKDFFDMATLGYQYDTLIPAPEPAPAPTATSTTLRIASSTSTAELGTTDTTLTVRKLPGAKSPRNVLGLADAASGKRTYLVLKDLHTWKQPEVLYHVYLAPARGGGVNRNGFVGTIHFFDAEFHDHGEAGGDAALGENFFSFDVTELLRRYERNGAVARDTLAVTIVPGGSARKDAGAMVATIELVQQ